MAGQWTEERRQKQREVALKGVAEGSFGGAGRGQGRKRKKRHSEVVAELVQNDGQRIYNRLMGIVESGTDANSMAAIRELRSYEESERKISLEEEAVDLDNMRRDQLLELVVGRLVELEAVGAIPGVIEVQAEVVRHGTVEADGAGIRGAIEATTE